MGRMVGLSRGLNSVRHGVELTVNAVAVRNSRIFVDSRSEGTLPGAAEIGGMGGSVMENNAAESSAMENSDIIIGDMESGDKVAKSSNVK